MSGSSNTLSGYVKTSNMYLIVLVALIAGFLSGVVFTSYRTSSMTAAPAVPGAPPNSVTPPISQEQSQELAALLQATRATPDNVNAWTQLGHLYFDTEQYEEAIQAYEKSLELSPSRPDVWTDLGVMYRRSGNPKQAVECFDRALSLKADHETALFNKGVVLMHDLKDAPAAVQAWEKLVQINPDAKMPDGRSVKSMVEHFRNANHS
jgi:cytochrome c-type biogenesis protein CcmH/NrfG